MQVSRKIPPVRLGTEAHTRTIFPFQLPRGLTTGTPVTVQEMAGEYCAVDDAQGKRWTVPVVCLDTGTLIWKEGHWVPED